MLVSTGTQAPTFSLYNSEKQLINLEDQRGQTILLLFFPLAFTSVCTKELCGVRDNISMYNNEQTQVFGISVDSLYTLARYKEDQQLNFTLLSDFNKVVSKTYNSLYDEFSYGMQGVGKRSAFIIDKDGTIVFSEILEDAGKVPDFESINKILIDLQNI